MNAISSRIAFALSLPRLAGPAFVDTILREVAAQHGVSIQEIKGRRRSHFIVLARHEAMYRLKNETKLSLGAIGEALGGMDHASVKPGIKRHEERLQQKVTP